MAAKPLFPLDAFYPTDEITHVCAAGESLALQAHSAAFARYMADKSAGHIGPAEKNIQMDHVRSVIAREWKVTVPEVGFASSVADGVSMVLESLHWEEGDNVVIDPDEFPSLIAPFAVKSQLNRERYGAEIPQVRYANADSLAGAVNNKTRLIAVSYISYLNGARVDLRHYRRLADSVGAILVVDYSQAAGYMRIDASVADFAFTCSHKWLLGVTGVTIAYWNRNRQPGWRPSTAGWHSLSLGHPLPQWGIETLKFRDDALCFTRGNPAHLPIYILRGSLDFLRQWETAKVERHVLALTATLFERLEQEGISPSTPRNKNQQAGSVTVHCDEASEITDELRKAGVYAWNGNGRVRFSFHGYNCLRDVERIMEVFPGLWRRFNA
ncbi:pyridoxal phosphate-dependent transferase [Aspergillus undulatus]|uniref:pyridoxal phosphate-dependent transferase n=1 Tax=Aspergillus undulatus TaxID=1810928 RepID=UPI003CCCC1C6